MTKVLGIAGGPDHPLLHNSEPVARELSPLFFHDAAAAILVDNEVVYAIEEERQSRQKHTNSFPVLAAKYCLASTGNDPLDIDTYAFFFSEDFYNISLSKACSKLGITRNIPARKLIANRLSESLDRTISEDRISFVEHHRAHAMSALVNSPFESSLILVIDGNGEKDSISLFLATEQKLKIVRQYPIENSLGHFYRSATQLLGFGPFDEYKLMGLAPYGDKLRYKKHVNEVYEFNQQSGDFFIDFSRFEELTYHTKLRFDSNSEILDPRRVNLAAFTQDILEKAALDIVNWGQKKTQTKNLCFTGGVAQNCVLNSHIARNSRYNKIFVYPNSSDAGCAVGAAYAAAAEIDNTIYKLRRKSYSCLLGSPEPSTQNLDRLITTWSQCFTIKTPQNKYERAAERIFNGDVIAWFNGRSEYGPRALGSRSILADPRPSGNKNRINQMVKLREGYRPFAPSVLEEDVEEYFDIPNSAYNLDHMNFVAQVKEPYLNMLGAITHIDGSARIQVVKEKMYPDFAKLISYFKYFSGVGVVLNTSFNCRNEPIVDSALDAILTFLSTNLDALYIGDYELSCPRLNFEFVSNLSVSISSWGSIRSKKEKGIQKYYIERPPYPPFKITKRMAEFLQSDNLRIASVTQKIGDKESKKFFKELKNLWINRHISLHE